VANSNGGIATIVKATAGDIDNDLERLNALGSAVHNIDQVAVLPQLNTPITEQV
jgi:hypothetical protein